MNEFESVLSRAESLMQRIEQTLPTPPPEPDWTSSIAFRWRKRAGKGFLQAVAHPHPVLLANLLGVDEQKKEIDRNTRQFVSRLPANNVLLTGARGTGKSSLVKAVLGQYADKGLRLIEVDRLDLVDLPDITDILYARPERFIIYCDDLSFDTGEPGYRALKVALDGSVSGPAENVLIYATSNRRHLMPEYMTENLETLSTDREIRPGESIDEKVSLSDRFGLWLSFYAFDQDEYLSIAQNWLRHFGVTDATSDKVRSEALLWALTRGSRSGRSAWQFARDWAGRTGMKSKK
ncbi:MAG: ATP-binding protein [Sulfuricellaceae bacterium]|nr:ATP-binding protein [Sulfuricellaceae bacterium]